MVFRKEDIMKRILCIILSFCLLVTVSGCELSLKNKTEPVNKSIDSGTSIINPTVAPITPVIDNSNTINDKVIVDGEKDINYSAVERDLSSESNTETSGDITEVSGKINDELVPAVVLGGIPNDTWEDEGYIPVIFYYKNSGGLLVPVTRKAVKQSSLINAVLSLMTDSSFLREELAQYNLQPVLPKKTKVISTDLKNGIAEINFNNEILEYKTIEEEKAIISSLVYTLNQLQNIQGVKFLFEGKVLDKLKFGTKVNGVMYKENTLINASKVNLDTNMEKTDVYLFRNSDDSIAYSIPVSCEHTCIDSKYRFTNLIDLLANTVSTGNATLIPSGTRLISYNLVKSNLVLNLSGEFIRYGGTTREEAILRQLTYSFSQFKGIDAIKILIDGKEGVLPEGTDISKPISIPKALNIIIK